MTDPISRDFERIRQLLAGTRPTTPGADCPPVLPFPDQEWMTNAIATWLKGEEGCDPSNAFRLQDHLRGNWQMVVQAVQRRAAR